MGTANKTGNEQVDEGGGIACYGIEHQRQYHENTTARDAEEIPALAVQPKS
jgi:hypothetical protein